MSTDALCADLPVPETIEEAIMQRDLWVNSAAQFHKNEMYYRDLLDQIGTLIGETATVADDGSRPGGILRAKLPELVKGLFISVTESRALGTALGLFPSVIKSGEAWSDTCATVLREAQVALAKVAVERPPLASPDPQYTPTGDSIELDAAPEWEQTPGLSLGDLLPNLK